MQGTRGILSFQSLFSITRVIYFRALTAVLVLATPLTHQIRNVWNSLCKFKWHIITNRRSLRRLIHQGAIRAISEVLHKHFHNARYVEDHLPSPACKSCRPLCDVTRKFWKGFDRWSWDGRITEWICSQRDWITSPGLTRQRHCIIWVSGCLSGDVSHSGCSVNVVNVWCHDNLPGPNDLSLLWLC